MQFTVGSSNSLQTLFVCFLAVIFWYLYMFTNGYGSIHFPPYRFSLKAPYSIPPFQKLVPFHHCEISHVLVVFRHTSRFPTAKNVDQFSQMESKLKDLEFSPEYQWLKNWTNPFSNVSAGELSSTGRYEAELIGKRFRGRYLGYFDRYSPLIYQVNTTYKERTYQTARDFLTGLFGAESINEFEINRNSEVDPILRFFDECLKYDKTVHLEKAKIVEELNSDLESSGLVKRVNARIDASVNFNLSDIHTLWKICMMEYLSARSSQMCGMFSNQDSLLLEYFYDRRTYLLKSHGFPINVEMSCILLKNIVHKLELALKGADNLRASFYFAHAETLVPLLALLNISTDSVLIENGPPAVSPDRNYIYGVLVPMGANLAFNLVTCGNGELYLTITLNEQLVLIGGNSQSSVLVSDFFNLTNSLIANCDLNSTCSLPTSD